MRPLVPNPRPSYIYVSNQNLLGDESSPIDTVSRPSGCGYAAQIKLGARGITLTYSYGVSDLGSQFLFYEPFSYGICLADLTDLIAAMQVQCITEDGIDLHFVPLKKPDVSPFSPSLKFYGFTN